MHRIDTAGATVEGLFQVGNPNIRTPATLVGPEWLNAVQNEVINIITAGGFSPLLSTNDTRDQLVLAIIKQLQEAPPNTMTLISPRALSVDDGFIVGGVFGMALEAVGSGVPVLASVAGLHRMTKPSGDLFVAGDPVYWDDIGGSGWARNVDASTRKLCGVAAESPIPNETDILVHVSGRPHLPTP